MAVGLSPLLLVNVLATLAAAGLVGFFWRQRRSIRGGTLLTIISLSALVWAGCYSASIAATGFEDKLFWYRLRYFGNAFGALAWFLFVTIYTGHGRYVTRRRVAVLVALEAVSVVVVWTNRTPFADGLHNLWYEGLAEATVAGATVVDPSPGLLYWGYTSLNGFLFLLAAGFLFELFIRPEQRVHGRRNFALLAGSFVPFALNVIFKLLEEPLDPTPIGLAFTMLLVAYAVFGFGVFDVLPVARASVVEALDVGVLVFDNDGVVVDANRLANELLDGQQGSVLGQSVTSVLAGATRLDDADTRPDDTDIRPDGDRLLSVETLTAGENRALEYAPEGSDRVYEVRISALGDGDLGHVALLYDVTDRRLRERRLRTQNEKLDEFASIVSHDLRNPLNVAVGYLGLVRDGDGGDDSLERVDGALGRMEALIDDLLALARSGRVIGETEPVSLETVVRAAWGNVPTEVATLSVEEGRMVDADVARLTELLENLFRNSVEHGSEGLSTRGASAVGAEAAEAAEGSVAPERGVTIRVGATQDGFFVEDDGPGLPPDKRDLVFERGYTTARTGTGFGLAIVREIVLAHGWEVQATEGRGGGARFEVRTVPRSPTPPEPPVPTLDADDD
ncbi:Signal transduction histidine kinase [Halogranum gelatinilyticum]|uniref:histidine kinase n=1 Tax=Halogranum gelatinilyticum TaxID=660521 RepID=A0A1G9SY21_9EURY|nr:histidine kinase N-terminal 7TM domain-containing protein [Halogranum gelatinilyticum]SDM40312.1 Signal transduction histidine kinase [Halogranum gelatinilyticum]